MRNKRYTICFILLFIAQLVLARYCQIGPYIYISLLPAMIMCMPMSVPTWLNCIIAFTCGMAVDGLADGVWGLNAMAIVPVAFLNKSLIGIFISREVVEREYSISFYQHGIFSIGFNLFIISLLYFGIYICFDTGADRTLVFNLIKLAASIVSSMIFGLVTVNLLCPRPER
ncbi:MAG: hypothetical protein MJY92_01570 [Bacteroidales bacterium]|nr:hypothetical protein [Bacteroidales bacterium]